MSYFKILINKMWFKKILMGKSFSLTITLQENTSTNLLKYYIKGILNNKCPILFMVYDFTN